MYSTCLKDDRYLVRCLTVAKEVNINTFVVDTGAKFTCCNCRFIDQTIQENEFSGCDARFISGFVKGEFVKFYQYSLRQFSIGNIDMGQQKIWVTFDARITDMVLGMDILKQLILISSPYDQKMYFCKDADDYDHNFVLAINK